MATGKAYLAVYLAPNASGTWPYDVGDDPSFHASSVAHGFGGRLSWGVCRPNVRNRINPGDVVVFFAAEDARAEALRVYRFAGWARVDELVSQTDIWRDDRLEGFRNYRNLLIRPVGDTDDFEHYEAGKPHPDWLWRLADSGRHAPKKDRWVTAGQEGSLIDGLIRVEGWRLRPAANYVVFDPEGSGTFVLAEPPLVARAVTNGMKETWNTDDFAKELHSLLFTGGTRRALRTTNRQQAHPCESPPGRPIALCTARRSLRKAAVGTSPLELPLGGASAS